MSVIPKRNERLDLNQGSTLDETWIGFEDDEVTPIDFTGWSAELKVRKTFSTAVLLAIASASFTPPAQDGIILGADGSVRVYVRDETLAAIDPEGFVQQRENDGSITYLGVWDIEFTNPAGETFRYIQGPVVFWPEVTYS